MTEEKIKPLYTKEFTRDFCLPIIETWCKGESTVPRQWTQNQQPLQPYLIFQNENEVVSCYMDEKGIDWVKSELENMMKSDSTYFAGVLETFMQKITRINPILVEEKTLNRVELIEFLDHLLDSWPWFEAFWWLVKVVEKDKMRFEQIKKVRLESERLAPSSDRVIRKSLLKIYPQLKELSSFLLVDEIKSNQLPSQEQLHARMKSFIYTNDTLFMGKSLNEIQKRFHIQIEQPNLPKTQAVNQIHGISAFGGVVKGKVKIVKSTRDLSKVHSGDILVAPMTIPSFIPAMERASAFITDEGGILCHAAIVSREMRKPCIIGTRNATQWLKDGDEVEVDGDNGTVKLVNPVITNEKDSIYINEVYWKLVVTRNMSFWHQYNSNIGHVFHSKDYGVKAPNYLLALTVNGTQTSCFVDPNEFVHYLNAIMECASTPEKVDLLEKKFKQFALQLKDRMNVCLKKINSENWRHFSQEYIRNTAGLNLTAQLGREGVVRLEKRLKELGYSEEKIPEMIGVITYPSHHTPLFESQLDLLKVGQLVQAKKLNEKQIQIHLNAWLSKYGIIPVNFCEEPWTMTQAREQLNQMLTKNCAEELKKYTESHDRRINNAKKHLKKINDETVSNLAYALQVGTYLNEFRKNLFCYVSLNMRPIFAFVAQKMGSDNWRDCYLLTNAEIESILENKLPNARQLVAKRNVIAYQVDLDGKDAIVSKEIAEKLHTFVQSQYGQSKNDAPEVDFIKGFSANKGKVKGIAKILLSSKDFHKLKSNEILVTTMTSVDFVPMMEKAAAFVTNEGGITSHAAIVSREMNKPCIIGTKNATQVIKDGDLVEVDGDNGVVRIVTRKNS